jgi:hypothetical protein
MLTVPMINQQDEVIGCIQLINKKRNPNSRLQSVEDFDREVIPFDQRSVELCLTLASQAGISLENALLYDDIQKLFESFVQASVTAIESRDPTTAGHSQRVATLTVGLAKTLDSVDAGPYRGVHFTEDDLHQIRYAGLLHDFGKVGVREEVLVKAKKLYPEQLEVIRDRFKRARGRLEIESRQHSLDCLLAEGREVYERRVQEFERELAGGIGRLEASLGEIERANEPTAIASGDFENLRGIAAVTFTDIDGRTQPLLTAQELELLSLR